MILSFLFWFPADWGGIAALNAVPFMNRMGIVFFISLALAVAVSLARPASTGSNRIIMQGVSFGTSKSFNIAGIVIILILIALYATWW